MSNAILSMGILSSSLEQTTDPSPKLIHPAEEPEFETSRREYRPPVRRWGYAEDAPEFLGGLVVPLACCWGRTSSVLRTTTLASNLVYVAPENEFLLPLPPNPNHIL